MAEIMFPLEDTDYTAADAQLWFATRSSGVFTGEHLTVKEAEGMAVTIGKGIAWLHYGEFSGAVFGNTAEITLNIGISNSTYDRIDRVVVRYDKVKNIGILAVISGNPASNPIPPEITQNEHCYEISLAQVFVRAGVTEITNAEITDERMDETVCGLMRDGVTGIDTSVIHNQAIAMLGNVSKEAQELAAEVRATADSLFQTVNNEAQSLSDDVRGQIVSTLENTKKEALTIIDQIEGTYNSAISGTLAGDLQIAVNERPKMETMLVKFASGAWENVNGVYQQTVSSDVNGNALQLDIEKDDLIVDVKIPNAIRDEVRSAWAELGNFEITQNGLKALFFAEPTVDLTVVAMRFRREIGTWAM